MKRKSIGLLLVMFCFLPCLAGAVSEEDFLVKTTENLVNLCTASVDDPLYSHAINFCHGFLVGAFHYHEATTSGPGGQPLVCLPDPRPSRNEAINVFIDWAKVHPEYWGDPAVETEFRFLMRQWPCQR